MNHTFFTTLVLTISALTASASDQTMDKIAEAYVHLTLAIGRLDSSYVDSYYGPNEWKAKAANGEPLPILELKRQANTLLIQLQSVPDSPRRSFLIKQMIALSAFLQRLRGEQMSLSQEAKLIYDIEIPIVNTDELEATRRELEELIPGDGTIESRIQSLRKRFIIPKEKLPLLAKTTLEELRVRTSRILRLPTNESTRLSFVVNKPWAAYCWYEGNSSSLLEVNADLPASIDGIIGTLAHEGYPGHHVFNSLLEHHLVKGNGWVEFSIYPLYSPQTLIAEGTAEAALGMVMTEPDIRTFISGTLCPMAGLDTRELDLYLKVRKLLKKLTKANVQATRMQLAEKRPDAEVSAFLQRYGLVTPERALASVEFTRINRTANFTYPVGKSLVEAYIGNGPTRIQRFVNLLSRPVTPAELSSSHE